MLIFTHPNPLIVENAKNLLESEGIAVQLKNNILAGGAGELAPTDTWPEVWLARAADESVAKQLLQALTEEASSSDWECINCGETNYPSFNLCWNCQHRKNK